MPSPWPRCRVRSPRSAPCPVFVEVTEELTIDLDDLAAQGRQRRAGPAAQPHARAYLRHGPADGDLRRGRRDGDRGLRPHDGRGAGAACRRGGTGAIGCYSTQTYKHLNSGEGGLLITDDAEADGRAAILLSGSYMLYGRHRAAPPPEAFERAEMGDAEYLGPDGQPARGDPAPAAGALGRAMRRLERALPRRRGGPARHAGADR